MSKVVSIRRNQEAVRPNQAYPSLTELAQNKKPVTVESYFKSRSKLNVTKQKDFSQSYRIHVDFHNDSIKQLITRMRNNFSM